MELNKSLKFIIQNAGWSTLHLSKAREAVKAMNTYRKQHPTCEITGSDKNIEIHHIVPVWSRPDLAADPDNFIALSASAHIHHIYGHDKNFRTKYVENIKDIASKMKEIKKEMVVINRPEVKINKIKTSWLSAFLRGWLK